MELIGVTKATFDTIVSYLGKRPYMEVASIMDSIRSEAQSLQVDTPSEEINPQEGENV